MKLETSGLLFSDSRDTSQCPEHEEDGEDSYMRRQVEVVRCSRVDINGVEPRQGAVDDL